MTHTRFALALAGLCLPALAQSNYWIANRSSNEIMRVSEWGSVLERVPTSTSLRSANVAPDGKVWIVRFIQTMFDIYDPATATMTPIASPAGSVSNVAFDAAGNGWVTTNSTVVHQYDANGTFLQTIVGLPNFSQGIVVDAFDNKWVAHRAAPGQISRIDPAGVVTTFPLVGTTALQPIGIAADYRGILQPSHLWITGDSAAQIVEVDGATGNTLNVYPLPMSSVAYPPTFDRAGRIWASSFGNATVVQLDETNGSVLQTLTLAPNNIGITTDDFGRIRTTARTAAGVPCEVRRIDPATGALEIPTLLQFGGFVSAGTQSKLSTQFQYALVSNQLGDMDGDGEANVSEILGGTSPTDPTSNSTFRVESFGVTQNGSTPTFEVQTSLLWVVGFATALQAPAPVPGVSGNLRLDPTTLITTVAGVGNTSLPIVIPANPALAGFEFFAQGVVWTGSALEFRNVSGMLVW